MKIEKLIPNPGKPHAPFVRLLLDEGTAVEFMVRDEHLKTLTTVAKRMAYVLECKEYHSPEGPDGETKAKARRALWDADDKARADAQAAAAKAAEYERFTVTPVGFVEGGVRVSITHHNATIPATIPADSATVEQNARAAFAAYEAAEAEKTAKLAAFAIG